MIRYKTNLTQSHCVHFDLRVRVDARVRGDSFPCRG